MNLRQILGIAGVSALTLAVGCGDDDSPTTDAGVTGGNGSPTTTGGDASMTTTGMTGMDGSMETNTIVDIAVGNPDFSILVEALTAADLVDDLSGPGPFTVFAPTNDAFVTLLGELGLSSLDEIPVETLTTFLLNHVVSGEVPSTALPSDPPTADTLADLTLWFDTSDGVMVNEATVTQADIDADNGVIHVVDDVINPASILDMAGYAGLTGLAGAIEAAADIDADTSVADALSGEGPFTVFAPTNAAFDAVGAVDPEPLRDILLYHVSAMGAVASGELADGANVVPTLSAPDYTDNDDTEADLLTLLAVKSDSGVTVNAANVAIADIKVTNGIIHVVDAVITRPDIVEMAGYAGLSTLAGALTDAGLVATLQGAGPFTVFAPTNDAFAALDAVPTGSALENVLTYHVASGDLMSDELSDGLMPTMVNGDMLTINLPSGGGVTVDAANSDANVAIADVVVTNGVVHVVDTVLLP